MFCCIMRLSGTLAPQFPAGTHGSQGQLHDVFLGGGAGSGPFLPAPLGSVARQPCLSPICHWEGAWKSISTLRSLFLKLCPQPLALKMKCHLQARSQSRGGLVSTQVAVPLNSCFSRSGWSLTICISHVFSAAAAGEGYTL